MAFSFSLLSVPLFAQTQDAEALFKKIEDSYTVTDAITQEIEDLDDSQKQRFLELIRTKLRKAIDGSALERSFTYITSAVALPPSMAKELLPDLEKIRPKDESLGGSASNRFFFSMLATIYRGDQGPEAQQETEWLVNAYLKTGDVEALRALKQIALRPEAALDILIKHLENFPTSEKSRPWQSLHDAILTYDVKSLSRYRKPIAELTPPEHLQERVFRNLSLLKLSNPADLDLLQETLREIIALESFQKKIYDSRIGKALSSFVQIENISRIPRKVRQEFADSPFEFQIQGLENQIADFIKDLEISDTRANEILRRIEASSDSSSTNLLKLLRRPPHWNESTKDIAWKLMATGRMSFETYEDLRLHSQVRIEDYLRGVINRSPWEMNRWVENINVSSKNILEALTKIYSEPLPDYTGNTWQDRTRKEMRTSRIDLLMALVQHRKIHQDEASSFGNQLLNDFRDKEEPKSQIERTFLRIALGQDVSKGDWAKLIATTGVSSVLSELNQAHLNPSLSSNSWATSLIEFILESDSEEKYTKLFSSDLLKFVTTDEARATLSKLFQAHRSPSFDKAISSSFASAHGIEVLRALDLKEFSIIDFISDITSSHYSDVLSWYETKKSQFQFDQAELREKYLLALQSDRADRIVSLLKPIEEPDIKEGFLARLGNLIETNDLQTILGILTQVFADQKALGLDRESICKVLDANDSLSETQQILISITCERENPQFSFDDTLAQIKALPLDDQFELINVVLLDFPSDNSPLVRNYLNDLVLSKMPEEDLQRLFEIIDTKGRFQKIDRAIIEIAERRPLGDLETQANEILIQHLKPSAKGQRAIVRYIEEAKPARDLELLAIYRAPLAFLDKIEGSLEEALRSDEISNDLIQSAVQYKKEAFFKLTEFKASSDSEIKERADGILKHSHFAEGMSEEPTVQVQDWKSLVRLIPMSWLPFSIIKNILQTEPGNTEAADEVLRRLNSKRSSSKKNLCEFLFKLPLIESEPFLSALVANCSRDDLVAWINQSKEQMPLETSGDRDSSRFKAILLMSQRLEMTPPEWLSQAVKLKEPQEYFTYDTEIYLRSAPETFKSKLKDFIEAIPAIIKKSQEEEDEEKPVPPSDSETDKKSTLGHINLLPYKQLLQDKRQEVLETLIGLWPQLDDDQKSVAARMFSTVGIKWDEIPSLHDEIRNLLNNRPRDLPFYAFQITSTVKDFPQDLRARTAVVLFESYRDRFYQAESNSPWGDSNWDSSDVSKDLAPYLYKEVIRRLESQEPLSQMAALALLNGFTKDPQVIEAYGKKLLRSDEVSVRRQALHLLAQSSIDLKDEAERIFEILKYPEFRETLDDYPDIARSVGTQIIPLVQKAIRESSTDEDRASWSKVYASIAESKRANVDPQFDLELYQSFVLHPNLLQRSDLRMSYGNPQLLQAAETDLQSSDEKLQLRALSTIPHLPKGQKFSVPKIRGIAESNASLKVRLAAVIALINYGEDVSDYISVLQEGLKSTDEEISKTAGAVITSITPEGLPPEELLLALEKSLSRLHGRELAEGKVLVVENDFKEKVVELLREKVKNGSAEERNAASLLLELGFSQDQRPPSQAEAPVASSLPPQEELHHLLCDLAQKSNDSLKNAGGEMSYPSAAWKSALYSLNLLLLTKASAFCPEARNAIESWLASNYPVDSTTCQETTPNELLNALRLPELSLQLHSQMRTAPQLYGDTFIVGVLSELLENPNGFKFNREKMLSERDQIASHMDQDLQRLNDNVFESDYSGNSNFNTYAISAAFAHLPAPSDKLTTAMQNLLPGIENLSGDELIKLSYSPNSKMRESARGASARAPVYHLGLYLHSQKNHEKYREALIASLENYRKYLPDLMSNVVRDLTHVGKDGLAPYYFYSSLPYVMASFDALELDKDVSETEREKLKNLRASIWNETYSQLFDKDTARFKPSGREMYSWSDFAWNALSGLAIVPMLTESSDANSTHLGIIRRTSSTP